MKFRAFTIHDAKLTYVVDVERIAASGPYPRDMKKPGKKDAKAYPAGLVGFTDRLVRIADGLGYEPRPFFVGDYLVTLPPPFRGEAEEYVCAAKDFERNHVPIVSPDMMLRLMQLLEE